MGSLLMLLIWFAAAFFFFVQSTLGQAHENLAIFLKIEIVFRAGLFELSKKI
jgi:hypothetical protein